MTKDAGVTTYDDVLDALDHCIETVDNADIRNRLRIAQRLLGSQDRVGSAAFRVAQDDEWEIDEDGPVTESTCKHCGEDIMWVLGDWEHMCNGADLCPSYETVAEPVD